MTLYSDRRKIIYQGNGATTTFDVPFYFLNDADIQVSVSDGRTVTNLELNTDYTLSGAENENGGTITTTAPVASGSEIAILRQVDYKQEMDIPENDRFPSKNMERALDRLTMQTQQLAEQVGRSVTVDVFSDTDPSSLVNEIEVLYDHKDEVITAAENIGSIVIAAQGINAIKDAPNQAHSARNSAIEAQNSAVTAQLMAAQAGESVSAAAASASAADASAAASAGSAQTAQDYAAQVVRRNIGDIFYTSRLDTSLNGAVECNGEQYNVADFTGPQAIPALLSAGKLPYVSITAFDAAVAANGSCRAFGWDGEGSAVFKVPKLNDVYLMAGTAASADEFISESLPNVAVNTGANVKIATSGAAGASSGAGALFFQNHSVTTGATMGGATTVGYDTLYLDMSRSNTVFKNGAKVRPDSVRYRAMVQIATGATDASLETCTGVLADVAGLKDASNFTPTGKSTISGLGFLDTTKFEDNIVNMTVTMVKQTFVAPANGHIYFVNESSTPITIYGTNCGSSRFGVSAGAVRQGSVSIQKGGIAYINTQGGTATLTQATFYYAKGEV